MPLAATDLAASADKTAAAIAPLPLSVRTLLPLAHSVRRLLAVREESPDERQAEPAESTLGAASPETTHPDRHRSAPPVARPDAHAAPTTGAVSSRADPASAPSEANGHRGGAT